MVNEIFEWDDEKEKKNIQKHKITFSAAATVFADDNRLEILDEEHSEAEERYKVIGRIGAAVSIVLVVYTPRGNRIRIISARKATSRERKMYYDNYT